MAWKPQPRFNLLLLENGEYFLEDYSVLYCAMPKTAHIAQQWSRKCKGRLKVCTSSLFFDPDDNSLPIVRLPFAKTDEVTRDTRLISDSGTPLVVVEVSEFLEMKAYNEVGPYIHKKCDGSAKAPFQHWFALEHTPVDEFLRFVHQLIGMHKNPKRSLAEEIDKRHSDKFDISNLVDYTETTLLDPAIKVDRIYALVNSPGCLTVTNEHVYFQAAEVNNVQKETVAYFALEDIQQLFRRRYMLRQCALELILEDGSSVLLSFRSQYDRDRVYHTILEQPRLCSLQKQTPTYMQKMTQQWQAREIDNYTYLMHLNRVADRTVNDLTQYPVMPWVLAQYDQDKLDLTDATNFRDLSRPIGALDEKRLKYFQDRFKELKAGQDESAHPPFLYGTHYSTPGYVLFYLVRHAPAYMLCLQNGRFDAPDRLFYSVKQSYNSVLRNHADLKELIPEFYEGNGDFLLNVQNLELGRRQNGERVHHVGLPPWASSPRHFVQQCRDALESDYVSEHIHHWIDLIFGYKQRGDEALKANNLFYYLTYEGAVDIEAITDPHQRQSIELQIREFGQTPKQVFVGPHPSRNAATPPPASLFASLAPTSKQSRVAADSKPSGMDPTPAVAKAAPAIVLAAPSPARVPTYDCSTFDPVLSGTDTLHSSPVTGVWTSTDGSALLSTCEGGRVGFSRSSTSDRTLAPPSCFMALSSCACSDARPCTLAVVGGWDGYLHMVSTLTGVVMHKHLAHQDAVSCVDAQGRFVVSGSWDHKVKVWALEAAGLGVDKAALCTFAEHSSEVRCVAINSSAQLLASGSAAGQVLVHDLEKLVGVAHMEVPCTVCSVLFSRDSRLLYICCVDGSIAVHRSLDGTRLALNRTGYPFRSGVLWGPGSLLTCGDDGFVRRWQVDDTNGACTAAGAVSTDGDALRCVRVSEDQINIVAGAASGKVYTWRSAKSFRGFLVVSDPDPLL